MAEKPVFTCPEYDLYANAKGIYVMAGPERNRRKWMSLEHYLEYNYELERQIADLERQVQEWEEFYASCTIGQAAS